MPRPKPLNIPLDFDDALRLALKVKPAKPDKSKAAGRSKKRKK
jgi:hypothetical protein